MEEHYGLKEQVTDLHTQCNILREQLQEKDDAFEKLRDRLKEKVGLNLPIYDYKCTCMRICNPPTYKLISISTCTRIYIYELHVYMYMYVYL